MKKKVEVTITKTVEIDIPDEILGESAIDMFSSYLWEIESIDEIFEHAAYHIVINNGDGYTADYIGLVGKDGIVYGNETPETTYKVIDDYHEIEVLQN